MRKSITPKQIKQNNKQLVYQYIYDKGSTTQQDITHDLYLSRPTVSSKLAELEEEGMIEKSGQVDSDYFGRKATAYSIVDDFKLGIGVEILAREIKIVCVNLYGKYTRRQVYEIEFKNNEDYFRTVCSYIGSFVDALNVSEEQILGVGIVLPSLVSPDATTATYGMILDCTGLSVDSFAKYLPFPCSFFHDSTSAAIAELSVSPELNDAFYLLLSYHLGAAMIFNRTILTGKHGQSATMEHINMAVNGKKCYCGKRGCAETLCSINSLLENSQLGIDDFFVRARIKGTEEHLRWTSYVHDLARMINIVQHIYDADFILGGYLAPFISDEDIKIMYEIISELSPFEKENDFIHLSKMPKHSITIGGALVYIQEFLEDNMSNMLSKV